MWQQPLDLQFQLLEIDVPLVACNNPPLWIDQITQRQSEHTAEALCERNIAHDYRIIHLIFLIDSLHRRRLIVHRNADDLQASGAISALPGYEAGYFRETWPAPCRPEIQQHKLAPELPHAEKLAVDVGAREIGRRLQGLAAGNR